MLLDPLQFGVLGGKIAFVYTLELVSLVPEPLETCGSTFGATSVVSLNHYRELSSLGRLHPQPSHPRLLLSSFET